jgi:azurin
MECGLFFAPMKTPISVVVIVAALALAFFAGCTGEGQTATPRAADVGNLEITGNDTMRFSPTAFTVNPGQSVTVTFRNIGSMPKAAMGHNWVLLREGVDAAAFVSAGGTHGGTDYIDPATRSDVLAATRILGPGESETVIFTAPETPGAYEYVCSFPGHYAARMRGVMTVVAGE